MSNRGSGALIQLATIGAQDTYINLNPQATLWRAPYKRVTKYAAENLLNRQLSPRGSRYIGTLARDGDLIKHIQLLFEIKYDKKHRRSFCWYFSGLPSGMAFEHFSFLTGIMDENEFSSYFLNIPVCYEGKDLYSIVNSFSLIVGSNTIETISSTHLKFHNQCVDEYEDPRLKLHRRGKEKAGWVVDIPFGILRGTNNLSVISLQYHNIEIAVDMKIPHQELIITPRVEYIYLDNEERRLFAANSHELLLPLMRSETVSVDRFLTQNHPVRYIAFKKEDVISDEVALIIEDRPREVFDIHQLQIDNFRRHGLKPSSEYCIIPFARDIKSIAPNGTHNFSRTQNIITGLREGAEVHFSFYNVAIFMGGMLGIKFS